MYKISTFTQQNTLEIQKKFKLESIFRQRRSITPHCWQLLHCAATCGV